jgi:hypothetical protein
MLGEEHPECLLSRCLRSTLCASQRYLTADVREEYEPASLLSANSVIFAFCQPGDWHHFIYCAIEEIHSTEDIFIYSFGFCSDHIGWNMVFLGVHDVW